MVKAAVTLVFPSIVTLSGFATPVVSPLQPVNVCAGPAEAVSSTTAPGS